MAPNVIIGYEESEEGRDAVALGAELARALELTPVIAHAITIPDQVLHEVELQTALKASADADLARIDSALPELEVDARSLASSSAPRALHDLAVEVDASLVVVGSTDRGRVGRVMPGSTAERLLHGSPCAVAVAARGFAADESRLLRLAVAFDGSPEASLALRAGVTLARRCNSNLTLLTVAHTPGLSQSGTPSQAAVGGYESQDDRRSQETLDHGVSRVPEDLPVRGHLMHGPPGEALVEVSEDFDLMLVGSRGYGPLRATLLGSTSRRLFGDSACSVMALPRGVSDDPFERERRSLRQRPRRGGRRIAPSAGSPSGRRIGSSPRSEAAGRTQDPRAPWV
jgi:nucleotide-binding universal stress UspA family protein